MFTVNLRFSLFSSVSTVEKDCRFRGKICASILRETLHFGQYNDDVPQTTSACPQVLIIC
jgi:hypothetical protein